MQSGTRDNRISVKLEIYRVLWPAKVVQRVKLLLLLLFYHKKNSIFIYLTTKAHIARTELKRQ